MEPQAAVGYPANVMKAASAAMSKAPATGLVDLPADELTDLLDDILAGDAAEEETGVLCPEPEGQANTTDPQTVEEAFARLRPLASTVLGEIPASAGEDEEPLLLDESMAVPPDLSDPAFLSALPPSEPPPEDAIDPLAADLGPEPEPLVLDEHMVVPALGPAEAAEDAEPLVLDDSMAVPAPKATEAAAEDAEPMILDDSMAVPAPEPAEATEAEEEAEPLVLDDSMAVPVPEAAPPQAAAALPPPDLSHLNERVTAILQAAADDAGGGDRGAIGAGSAELPAAAEALSALLAEMPPASDFAALDLLYACWPRNTQRSDSRALLAAATNLATTFGMPHRLPMAMSKAWRMLDAEMFEAQLAARLAAIATFIRTWQREQKVFLILEFGEIELIEYLFEALPPGGHQELLADVMNFKVLSNRRMGLVRRIPTRLRKQIQPLLPDRKNEAMILLAHAKALLDIVANPNGFAPIVEAATKAREEVEKLMKQTASAGVAPPGGGQGLGRIG